MSIAQPPSERERLQLPATLRRQLDDLPSPGLDDQDHRGRLRGGLRRRRRLPGDVRRSTGSGTPRPGRRAVLFGLAVLAVLDAVPVALYRWVWRNRRPDQLARLLARKHPRIGDQLLGAIELARDDSEQARSRQTRGGGHRSGRVSTRRQSRLPPTPCPAPRHRLWAGPASPARPRWSALGLFVFCPRSDRLVERPGQRLSSPPGSNTPSIHLRRDRADRPTNLVVAHGEIVRISGVTLAKSSVTASRPPNAQVRDRRPLRRSTAPLVDGSLLVRAAPAGRQDSARGQASATPWKVVEVEPMLRPELNPQSSSAITLPDYVGRPGIARAKDVRGRLDHAPQGEPPPRSPPRRPVGNWRPPGWMAPSGRPGFEHQVQQPDCSRSEASRDVQFRWVDRQVRPGRQGAVHAQDQRSRR